MTEHRHYSEREFEALVSSALDELPIEFQRALDPERLRLQVTQTVRHEVGHHLGFDEAGVRTGVFGEPPTTNARQLGGSKARMGRLGTLCPLNAPWLPDSGHPRHAENPRRAGGFQYRGARI